MKRTLDQIRASVALQYKNNIGGGADGGDKIKGFPTMIQNNGLLGALGYAVEGENKHQAELEMAKAIIAYLNTLKKEGYNLTGQTDIAKPNALAKFLADDSTPTQIRRINAEVMAFLNYLRRFAS